ncbi:hypothetical protein [Leptospira ellinghausenii]|nr:hypothetical protein [Leptospira ellinghausenii]
MKETEGNENPVDYRELIADDTSTKGYKVRVLQFLIHVKDKLDIIEELIIRIMEFLEKKIKEENPFADLSKGKNANLPFGLFPREGKILTK